MEESLRHGFVHAKMGATYCVFQYRPGIYCGASPTAEVHRPPNPVHRPGLFAVFYDGETQPVAAFVLEQDAERYAKKYSGGADHTIKRIYILSWGDIDSIDESCTFPKCDEKATQIAAGRGDDSEPKVYCDEHAEMISTQERPSYVADCPNCHCFFGVWP